MSMYICGDTHGMYDIDKLRHRYFDSSGLTKNDYVLICGDFGGVWDCGKHDKLIQEWFGNKPWTTLWVDGNHENHEALDTYPTAIWKGGEVHRISPSIIHLKRGQVYNIDGHKLFTMGGATSVDKALRKEGESWWSREMPSDYEYEEAVYNLKNNGNKVDFIVTHCASSSVTKCICSSFDTDRLTDFLQRLEGEVSFKHWYFGHYHIDRKIDNKHTALYDRVVRLW